MGKAGNATKPKLTVKVSCWVTHAQKTERPSNIMIVHIPALAVSEVHFQTWWPGNTLYTADSLTAAHNTTQH